MMKLPTIGQRGGFVVRLIYRMLALVAALYVAAELPLEGVDLFRNSPALAQYGLAVQRGARGALPVIGLYPSAARAGLHVGDVVVGVDGALLRRTATRFDLAARLDAARKPVKLLVVDARGLRQVALAPQTRRLGLISLFYGMQLWAFGVLQWTALAVPMAVLLGAAFLLYKRRPNDPEAMLLAFSFLALIFSTSDGSWPLVYARVHDVVPDLLTAVGTALLCVAVAGVPDGHFISRASKLTVLAAGLNLVAQSWVLLRASHGPIIGIAAVLTQYAAVALAVASLLARYRASATMARQQLKCVLIGAVIALMAMATPIVTRFSGLEQALSMGGEQALHLVTFMIFHIAVPIGLLVSVLAYRLYDSEAAITRSAAYAALSVAVVGVFAASESVAQSFGQRMVSSQLGSFSGTLAAVFTAMMIGPMHARIKRVAERSFRKDFFRMREGLPPLVGDLRETTQLRQIAAVVMERLRIGVRPVTGAIVVGDAAVATLGASEREVATWRARWALDAAAPIDCERDDALFPTRVALTADGAGPVGWLLLGPRPDGSLYGRDERKALIEIADPVARALAIAAAREARAARHEENDRALRSRIEQLEAAIARLNAANPATSTQ